MPGDDKIHFRCPHCNKSVGIHKQHAGKRGRCPGCGQQVQIPQLKEPAAAEPEPEEQPHAEILAHMEQHHGPVQKFCLLEIVPETGITIHVVPPSPGRKHQTLFTAGVSDAPMNVPSGQEIFQYAELVMHLPATWPTSMEALQNPLNFWPFQWLKQIGYYPHANETWLGGRYTIIATDDPPEPLAGNTKLSCLMLTKDSSPAGELETADGRQIIFYEVLPLYTEERDLDLARGVYELTKLLKKHNISNVVDLRRPNVALK